MADYVSNKEFLAALIKRRESFVEGEDKPQISNYLGECIYQICNRLSYKSNFINYSFRDEMVSDALENCINYIDCFNHEKSSNPFAYFTQIAYFAFLRRIDAEKKQAYIKGKILQNSSIEELVDYDDQGNPVDFMGDIREQYYYNTQEYEDKMAAKKKPKTVRVALDL